MTREQRLTLLATIVGSGIVILDSTVVNLALPHIARNLHASFADLQWIVDGYMLSLSSLILLGGSLGDIFGRKRIYLLGLAGFGAVSLLCGLAPSSLALILLRVLQGVFGALLVPGGLAIINTNFPADKRGVAIGSWSAWSAIFAAMGPLVGGYILGIASWRWIFFINVPLVVLCYICGSIGIKDSRDALARRVDFWGAGLAVLALVAVTYGLIEGPSSHWQPLEVIAVGMGLILSAGFLYREQQAKDPMVPLRLFKSRNFTGSNLMTFAMYGAFSGFYFALVIHLQTALHYSSIKAGVSLLPPTVLLMLFSKWVGGQSAKHGPRLFMTAGPLLAALGIISFLRLQPGQSYWAVVFPGILLFGVGLTLLVAPLTTTVMSSVKDSSSGIASGVNNAVSRVAGLVVVALLGLFGVSHFYNFAVVLCAGLAALGGIVSFFMIEDHKITTKLKNS